QSAEAAQQAKSRAIQLMQDFRIGIVDGLVEKLAEQLVELFGAVEAPLRFREKLRLRTHAGGARGGDDRRLFIELHAHGGSARVQRPQLLVVLIRLRKRAAEELLERRHFPRLEPQIGDTNVVADRGGESR